MNGVKVFIDTNVIAYLHSQTDEQKRNRAYSVLKQYDRQISTQVLNEFSNVCIKKWKLTREKIHNLIGQICLYFDVGYIYEDNIRKALKIHGRYHYRAKDAIEKLFEQIKCDMDGKVFVTFVACIIRSYLLSHLNQYLMDNSTSMKKVFSQLSNITIISSGNSFRFTKALTKK